MGTLRALTKPLYNRPSIRRGLKYSSPLVTAFAGVAIRVLPGSNALAPWASTLGVILALLVLVCYVILMAGFFGHDDWYIEQTRNLSSELETKKKEHDAQIDRLRRDEAAAKDDLRHRTELSSLITQIVNGKGGRISEVLSGEEMLSTTGSDQKLALIRSAWNPEDQMAFILHGIRKFYEKQAPAGTTFKVTLMEPDPVHPRLNITGRSYHSGNPGTYTDEFRFDGGSGAALAWATADSVLLVRDLHSEMHGEGMARRRYIQLRPHHDNQQGSYAALVVSDDFTRERLCVINITSSKEFLFDDRNTTCVKRTRDELQEFGQRIAFEIRCRKFFHSLDVQTASIET